MNRLAILLVLGAFGAAAMPAGLAGCGSGPYNGRADRLKRPRAKKRPDDKVKPTEVTEGSGKGSDGKALPVSDEKCRTNFFAEPKKPPRKAKEARNMAMQADSSLVAADRQFGAARQQLVVEAMGTLFNALNKDPYGPEPTYKLAAAYAMLGKKSCSLALLERLKGLAGMAGVDKEATRAIERAARDPAFDPFAKEARTAMGQ